MTVKQLKEKLQKFPDDMEVVSSLVDYGFTTIDSVTERTVFYSKTKGGGEYLNESNYDWGDKNIVERKKIKAVNLAYQDFGDNPNDEHTEEKYNKFQKWKEEQRLNTPASQMFSTAYVNPVFMGVGQHEMVRNLNERQPISNIIGWFVVLAVVLVVIAVSLSIIFLN